MNTAEISRIHGNIMRKFNLLSKICEILLNPPISDEIELFRDQYIMGSVVYLLRASDADNQESAVVEYERYVLAENIISNIETFGEELTKLPGVNNPQAWPYIQDFKHTPTLISVRIEEPQTCPDCNACLEAQQNMFELYCSICGKIHQSAGMYANNPDVAKPGSYKPSRHCEDWVLCIFAAEKTQIPPDLEKRINACMSRDCVSPANLTCKLLRKYLKELRATKYNINIPKIRKNINGCAPPQPTAYEYNMICQLFDFSDDIYTKICASKSGKSRGVNRRYYPHFIRKIIEHVYWDNPATMYSIIEGIHQQEQTTTEDHDMIWNDICDRSGGVFEFSKTAEITFYSK